MSDSIQLLPCPFCGGKAVVARSDDEPPVYFAGCESLWCRGSAVTLQHWRSPEEAAELWNRRAPGRTAAPRPNGDGETAQRPNGQTGNGQTTKGTDE